MYSVLCSLSYLVSDCIVTLQFIVSQEFEEKDDIDTPNSYSPHEDPNIVSIDNEGTTAHTQGTVTSSIQTFPFLNDTDYSEDESTEQTWNLFTKFSLLRFRRSKRKYTKFSLSHSIFRLFSPCTSPLMR